MALVSRLDEQAWVWLLPHQGKTVGFALTGFSPFYFRIEKEGLHLCETTAPDLLFSGTLEAFLMLLKGERKIHLQGDMDLAQALYQSWDRLDLDWQGQWAPFIGGTLAHQLTKGWRAGKQALRRYGDDRLEDCARYLQDEKAILPAPQAVADWLKAVDTLRHDVARFEKKLLLFERGMGCD